MKTILATIFAIAVMVLAFNATPSHADEKAQCKWIEVWEKCEKYRTQAQIDELDGSQDPDQAGNERDVADSGAEGSTSAAGANGNDNKE
ncbi:MAG: hypothetical protein OXF09_02005 [Hyphomicrobiales bacterium]|nr:hypothetical protein [Hyphomicrobiales bacterium]